MEEAKYDWSATREHFQTNRRIILMHHVVYRDSAYVQTLSEDDMQHSELLMNKKRLVACRWVI